VLVLLIVLGLRMIASVLI